MINAHPLDAWVCHGGAGQVANHLPDLLDRSPGPQGTRIARVARAVQTPAALRARVERLNGRHEARQADPWRVGDAPPNRIDRRR